MMHTNYIIVLRLVASTMMSEGAGGKGTWGRLLDTDCEAHIDRNDPNYDSGEVIFRPLLAKL